jgi:hypothetical protein
MRIPRPICRILLEHAACLLADLARAKVGRIRLARMPIMAITTNNSINVNPSIQFFFGNRSTVSPRILEDAHTAPPRAGAAPIKGFIVLLLLQAQNTCQVGFLQMY